MPKTVHSSQGLLELVAQKEHPRLLKHRATYHGHWEGQVINAPRSVAPADGPQLPQEEFVLPEAAYHCE